MNKEEFLDKFNNKKLSDEQKKELTQTQSKDNGWLDKIELVKNKIAPSLNFNEFKLFIYMAKKYKLDPLKKEIWAVKYGSQPAQIFVGRDGLLTIAHRSGKFGSMETSVEFNSDSETPRSATCIIYRKDYDKPFKSTVYFSEYNLKRSLWLSKPIAMLTKVAEATCLRRAFNIHGFYIPEEVDYKTDINKHNTNNTIYKEVENNEQ